MKQRRTRGPSPSTTGGDRPPACRAFTIVELLISVTVIILLLSILIVAVSAAQRTAQRTKTESLISAIEQAMVRFKEDIGYYPPVLDMDRNLPMTGGRPWVPDPNDPGYAQDVQNWYSITSLPDYLLGYGNEQQDGYGDPSDPTRPALGIRNPESDGVWSATILGSADGLLTSRNVGLGAARTAKVYGPYLELKDERLLASIDPMSSDTLQIYLPGDVGYDPDAPKVIVDYWGQPLRYYRPAYPQGGLKMSYRPGTALFVPTLADVYLLRPFNVKPGQDIDARFEDANGDRTSSIDLKAARFAILSGGPDLGVDETVRRDPDDNDGDSVSDENADNIVGAGQ